MTTDLAIELGSLRGLARALARDDADDLVQDVAVTALEKPPPADRPRVPWLVAVLRNRWRMDRRAETRRLARDAAAVPEADPRDPASAIDRARVLQHLAEALVALDEPFRTTVIARYLDGKSAAQIAREQQLAAGTVRWRLHTGLQRLREALDQRAPRERWRKALAPIGAAKLAAGAKGALLVKVKSHLVIGAAALVLALIALATWQWTARAHHDTPSAESQPQGPTAGRAAVKPPMPSTSLAVTTPAEVRRAFVERVQAAGGVLSGRVVNWSTGDPVSGAELTFATDDGATTLKTDDTGAFELAPAHAATFTLVTVVAQGFLPYAPEYLHSPVQAHLAAGVAIRGLRLFMFPALDYHGHVVDAAGAPVAGAHVRLLGTPEQSIYKLPTEWTSDRDGGFTFHAPDGAVLEAAAGVRRGWAALTGKVAISKQLTIVVGEALARDATITGHVVDKEGHPVPDVLVSASPANMRADQPRAGATAVSAADGTFRLESLDRDTYDLLAEADGYAPLLVRDIAGGAHDVQLALDAGEPLAGTVVTSKGDPVPAYTLIVAKRDGARRDVIATRSVADPDGKFSLRVPKGSYDLVASAPSWAPSPHIVASAGDRAVKITVSAGGTLRGVVRSAADGSPVRYARVMHEELGGGASAVPANTGTVTRADGSFELTGIPAGKFSLTVAADSFNEKIEGGLVAQDDVELPPVQIQLTPVVPGEQPAIELVGIGVGLSIDRDALRVDKVIDGGGAQAAGIVVGDRIIAVDGTATSDLGLEGAVAKIRGVEGTTVAITLQRGNAAVTLQVERRKLKA